MASFSPDGKLIVYQSNESGREEIYIRAFPSESGQWQVSNLGGTRPQWSNDGKEIYYLGPNAGSMMAAGVRAAGSAIQVDAPRQLFAAPIAPTAFNPYAVTADGQRFLAVQPVSGALRAGPLTVVTNWQAGLAVGGAGAAFEC